MPLDDKDLAYCWDMLSAARECRQIVGTVTLEEFQKNVLIMRATERCIEIVGEAARRVSITTRESYPEIPWQGIIGQRNILAHEYGQIDYELLYKTAVQDIPALIARLQRILPTD